MKKFISIILSLVLVLSLATVASAASITIKPSLPTGGTSTGETYNAYKIFDATYTGDNVTADSAVSYTIAESSTFFSVIQNYTVDGKKVFELDEINDSSVYNVKKLESYDAAALATALKAVITDTTTVAGSVSEANAAGNYVIEGLDKGYYIITSTLGSKLIVDTLGSAEIDTKNEYPSLTKKIVSGTERLDTITADRGATITFEVTVTIPATAVGAITVHDDAAAALTGIALVDGTTVVTKAASVTDGCDAEFVISAETVAANLGETVTFQYTATLAASAATATEHKNEAWLTYSAFTSTKDSVSVYTYQVDVFKYTKNGENKVGLAGAGFVLKNSNGKYYKNTDGNVSWVDSETGATEYTTAEATYTITFAGLANGTYTLVEKTVPAGYNKANDVPVTINGANLTDPIDEQGSQIEVLNSTGSELPSTGGIGTTIFYVVGCLLMTGAVVLLVTKRRMGNA